MSDIHFTDESFESSAEISPKYLGIFGVAFVGLFLGTLLALNSLYVQSAEEQYEAKDRQAPTTMLNDLHAKEMATLTEVKTLDKQTGRYQISVEDARALVLRDYEQKWAAAKAGTATAAGEAAPADGAVGAVPADGAAAAAAPADGTAPAEAAAPAGTAPEAAPAAAGSEGAK